MKDIDLGKEYVIPSPGYRNIRDRNSLNQRGAQDGIKFRQEKYKDRFNSALSLKQVDCQDALETAARAEGLPLESTTDSHLRVLDEEHPKGKYHYGLNLMKPIRTTSKLAYKKGELLTQDVWPLSTHESSEVNCRRLERLWHQEVHDCGQDDASLRRVVWNFCRTRLIISIACLMITQLAGFSGPVMKVDHRKVIHAASDLISVDGLDPGPEANNLVAK
ncbi:hypothetical protein E2320_009263 [Naja naja]|nr:hypothetical protein E2320_009263 [Naja naja]